MESAGTHAQPYRRRRPETTTLHRIVREHLETYLTLATSPIPWATAYRIMWNESLGAT